jgi:hypothetical protein
MFVLRGSNNLRRSRYRTSKEDQNEETTEDEETARQGNHRSLELSDLRHLSRQSS